MCFECRSTPRKEVMGFATGTCNDLLDVWESNDRINMVIPIVCRFGGQSVSSYLHCEFG
jgi:hypothetical protein